MKYAYLGNQACFGMIMFGLSGTSVLLVLMISVIDKFFRSGWSVGQYKNALAGTVNQSVLLLVNRGGATHFVVVQPQ